MKKLFFVFFIAVLLLGNACADGGNLLRNGGFEEVNTLGMPADWHTVSYYDTDSNTLFAITDEEAHSGAYSAKIMNANLNDARYVTRLKVEPESMYRVSGYILVKEMDDVGNGANFGLENEYAASESVFNTNGEWQYIEWYGETDTGQTEVDLGVRVGGYSAESKGTAYFDDIVVEKVQTLPEGVFADFWFTLNVSDTHSVDGDATPQKSTGWFILLALLFAGLTALMARWLLSDSKLKPASEQNILFLFALGMMAAFVLRLWLGGSVEGYGVDIGCFSAWSLRMASEGPIGFYSPDYFCDYPPGYILMLWPIGQLISMIGYSNSPGILLLVKLIPILCDMVTAMLLFAYAKKHVSIKAAAFVGLFFAFNPSVLVTGAAWGQVDSVLALLLVLTAVSALEKRWRVAFPVFILAILSKPQALLFVPVGLAWLIAAIAFDRREGRKVQIRQLWQGIALAVLAALVVVIPFQIRQDDPLWLMKRYADTLASYNYAVLNTANLMYLLGGNWSALDASSNRVMAELSRLLPVGTGLLLLALGLWKLRIEKGWQQIKAQSSAVWQTLNAGKPVNRRDGTLRWLCFAWYAGWPL